MQRKFFRISKLQRVVLSMKSTGVVRHIDEAGRLVLPKELRREFSLVGENPAVEIFTDKDTIVLRRYAPACVFCGSLDDVFEYEGVKVCAECGKKIGKIAKCSWDRLL